MSALSPNFFIGNFRIGTVEGASCINMGNNFPVGFESHKKQNQGLGTISGDNNRFDGLKTLLDDSDVMDMLTSGAEKEVPDWIKELIISRLKEQEEEESK
ncbi:hypothetical protein [Fictibacillus fluitans]|uniref:Uncharacterized protein n=1 Tax=Fictibacillus fluitans TaxID=3058422 RepID=A0ABT8I0Y9_9BACL|nr:hypothetical protein [Fictibacillus sp. NE201]MDN4526706.1 hypothetical protein [Fictibacillus sp. NE201]